MNALPPVSDDQIKQMNQIAEKQYGADVNKEVEQEQQAEASEEQQNIEESSAVEPEQQAAEESEEPQESKSESSKEMNLRILRERAQKADERALKAEREREQLMRFVSDRFPHNQQPQQAAQSHQEEDLEFSIAPDELAEGKHLAKLKKQIDRLEKQIKQGTQQSNAMSTEAQLRTNYPDIEKVLSKSNISSLSELYPEIAKTIGNSSTDMYSQAVSAYTMIKKLGIHADDTFVQEKARVQANAVKPRPLASLSPQQGESPLSKANAFANGLTPELQKQLWKETKDAMKNG